MDLTKHNVTIPFADYEELLKAKSNSDITRAHFITLENAGFITFLPSPDLSKTPKKAQYMHDNALDKIIVKFEY